MSIPRRSSKEVEAAGIHPSMREEDRVAYEEIFLEDEEAADGISIVGSSRTGQSSARRHLASNSSAAGSASQPRPLEQFTVPTMNRSLSSGFPYHPRLYELGVLQDEWFLFSSDIVQAAQLSLTSDYAAWTTGVAVGVVSFPFLLFFSPVVGYYSGKAVHKKTVTKKVKKELLLEGDLRSVLQKWNEEKFIVRGFQAWLEFPNSKREIKNWVPRGTPLNPEPETAAMSEASPDEPLGDVAEPTKDSRAAAKAAAKAKIREKRVARRFRIVIIPNLPNKENHLAPVLSVETAEAPAVVEVDAQRQVRELEPREPETLPPYEPTELPSPVDVIESLSRVPPAPNSYPAR